MKYNFEFQITSYCQAKCASCQRTIDIDNFTPTHYPIEKFENTLNNLSSVDVDIITLCGEYGDPMMHPQIDKFIETALEFAPSVRISTNGGLRTPDWYESIAKKYKNKYKKMDSYITIEYENGKKEYGKIIKTTKFNFIRYYYSIIIFKFFNRFNIRQIPF